MTSGDKKKAMVIGGLITAIIILLLFMRRPVADTVSTGRDLKIPTFGMPGLPLTIFDIPELKLYEPRGSCGCGCINPEKVEVEKIVYRDAAPTVQPYSKTTPYQPTIFGISKNRSSARIG